MPPGGSRGRGLWCPCPRGAEASGPPEAAGSLHWGTAPAAGRSGGGSRPRWGSPGGLGVVSGPSLGLAEAHAPEGRCLRGISESKESEKRTSRRCSNLPELLSCLNTDPLVLGCQHLTERGTGAQTV